MQKSAKVIRLGVLGGGFGAAFYWHEHPNCVVEAVCDLLPERREALMKTYQCSKAYTSLNEMLADRNIDAVAVFSGAPSHVSHSVACMEAGKHVISAVPAAVSLEQAEELRAAVEETGQTYMMAETSYYRQPMITARKLYEQGKFGELFYTQAEYFHPNPPGFISPIWTDGKGNKTWRYCLPPMYYPTHATAFLIGLTGERLTKVMCLGFDDGTEPYHNNAWNNPYGSQVALYKTDKSHILRHAQIWRGAVRGCERAEWYGSRMSFFMDNPNGAGSVIVRTGDNTETDEGGFTRQLPDYEQYDQPNYWETDMVPETMRHGGGHDGAETFLTHEFIDALIHDRKPTIDVYEALAYTVPGIIAHHSSMAGGKEMDIPSFDRTGR